MWGAEQRLYDVAASQDGVFCVADARAAGLSESQIRLRAARRWRSLYQGVFLAPGAPPTPRGALRAACKAGAPHAVASHRSAAALYGVPGGRTDLAELTCPRWLRAKHPGVIVHERTRVLPDDVRTIDGIPVARPELVVLQLASSYRSVDFCERVMLAMRRSNLIDYESMDSLLARHARRGVRGVRVTRAALARWGALRAPTESEMETSLYQLLRDAGYNDVVTQHVIVDWSGAFVARVDLALVAARVAIEYDSVAFHTDELSLARDAGRRNRIHAAGWIVFTARRDDLRHGGPELLAALRAHLAPNSAPRRPNSAQER